jgi:hypothetical protein
MQVRHVPVAEDFPHPSYDVLFDKVYGSIVGFGV